MVSSSNIVNNSPSPDPQRAIEFEVDEEARPVLNNDLDRYTCFKREEEEDIVELFETTSLRISVGVTDSQIFLTVTRSDHRMGLAEHLEKHGLTPDELTAEGGTFFTYNVKQGRISFSRDVARSGPIPISHLAEVKEELEKEMAKFFEKG